MAKIRVHPLSLGPNRDGSSEVFSAFYSLGCLVAYAKVTHERSLCERFEFGRITPTGTTELPDLLDEVGREPGIVLLSSYVWNHPVNMEFARALRERCPQGLVIVGGPQVPRTPGPCAGFFKANPWVDVAVRAEGEITLAEILKVIAESGCDADGLRDVDLSNVAGLTFICDGELTRTPDRVRVMDLSLFPSPYTTGEYDHWLKDRQAMPIETNRGCPYGCTFCDWGSATLSKIAKVSMERVFAEVEYSAKNRIHTIGFCDANFGILERDLEIVRFIVETKNRYGFPRGVGYTNAKTAKPRLGQIMKLLRDAGLTAAAQISMQTTDEQVLKNVERANIKTSEYRKMIEFFHAEDIPTASDVMVGLPGQTFETCKADLQFFFDHMVLAVVFATSVMPNAPMADEEYQRRFRIVVGSDGMVDSTYSFTREEYDRMFELCLAYKLFVKLGVLKYLLYFAQREHGIKALDFVATWVKVCAEHPERYPISHRIKSELLGRDYRGGRKDWLVIVWSDDQGRLVFDALDEFYREILEFFDREHGVHLQGTDVEAILAVNREVMPRKGRTFPARISLPHDVATYFSELRRLPSLHDVPADHARLVDRAPGYLDLPDQPICTSYQYADIGLTYGGLELTSNVRI